MLCLENYRLTRNPLMKGNTKQEKKYNSRRYLLFGLLAALLVPSALLPETTASRKAFELSKGPPYPRIRVTAKKDPSIYDSVEPATGGLEFHLFVNGRCPEKHSLKSAYLTVGQTKVAYPVNREHRSIGGNHGRDSVEVPFTTPYYKPDLTAYYKFFAKSHTPKSISDPVEACNAELERLVKEGSKRASLLQSGFEFHTFTAYKGTFEVLCQNNSILGFSPDHRYSDSADLNVKIHCKPTGYKEPQRTPVPDAPPRRTPVPDPPIESVSVTADPPETEGRQCPVYVNFRGRITAGEKSQYSTFNTKYRFVGNNNYKTDWLPVSVVRGQPRSVNGRRFIQAPENDPGGSLKTPGGTVKTPLYRSWMTLEVMLPDGTKRSERANFTVDCNPQPKFKSR